MLFAFALHSKTAHRAVYRRINEYIKKRALLPQTDSNSKALSIGLSPGQVVTIYLTNTIALLKKRCKMLTTPTAKAVRRTREVLGVVGDELGRHIIRHIGDFFEGIDICYH